MGRGGKRSGAGRKPGIPNRATRELKELAREYTNDALAALVSVLHDAAAPASAKVAAATALLDRGHGRPAQYIEADVTGSIEHRVSMMSPAERLVRLRELQERARLTIEAAAEQLQ
jgi:hypothetical protein